MRQPIGLVMMIAGAAATAFFLYLPGDAQPGFEGISYLLAAPFIGGGLAVMIAGYFIYKR